MSLEMRGGETRGIRIMFLLLEVHPNYILNDAK
jgi:hypothetical protein